MQVSAEVGRQRGEPGLRVHTGTRVGAIPLRSPVTGRSDFGLVVAPRFEWSGVGDLLATTGFRVLPELLPIDELPQSERHVPHGASSPSRRTAWHRAAPSTGSVTRSRR